MYIRIQAEAKSLQPVSRQLFVLSLCFQMDNQCAGVLLCTRTYRVIENGMHAAP